MFYKRGLFVPAALIFAGVIGVGTAGAQPTCYTNASLQGSYAIIGTYGSNVAVAFGMRYFDGNGNMTGTFVVNEPTPGSTTGQRTITTGTQKGTYTVNCDGTGVINRIVTQADGSMTAQSDDFIITGAAIRNVFQLLATTLADAQRTPSAIVPGGIFLTRAYSRLPDRLGVGQ